MQKIQLKAQKKQAQKAAATQQHKRKVSTKPNHKKPLRKTTTKTTTTPLTPVPLAPQSTRSFSSAQKEFPIKRIPSTDETKRFQGKLVLITGAGAGIGRAAAIQIAKEGGNVMCVDLNGPGLEETKAMCLKINPASHVEFIQADCADDAQIQNYVNKTVEIFGRIDCFYNNHGIEGPHFKLHEYPIEDMNRVMTINANSIMWNMKHVIAHMVEKQGFGSITNCSSIAGLRAVPNLSPYVASKHAVSGITKAAALEYAQMLNINSVHPGGIRTEMIDRYFSSAAAEQGIPMDKLIENFASGNPAKRFGTPEEVAYTVAFLLSDQASLLNGVQINLDSSQIWQYTQ